MLQPRCKNVGLFVGGALSDWVYWRADAAVKGEARACKIFRAMYAVDGMPPEQVAVKTGVSALTEVRASFEVFLTSNVLKGDF